MDSVNVSELVARLGAEEESVRKMSVFKLQSAIGDPSFADVFIYEGGLPKLRFLALHSTGNTLAYCLTSLARLLELDKGWDHVTDDLIERVSRNGCDLLLKLKSNTQETDCRPRRRATTRQCQPRRHVSACSHRRPSLHPPQFPARRYWLRTIEARSRHTAAVSPLSR